MTGDQLVWRCATLLTGELAGPLLRDAAPGWVTLNARAHAAVITRSVERFALEADDAMCRQGPFAEPGGDGVTLYTEALACVASAARSPAGWVPLVAVMRRAARHADGGGCLTGVLLADGTDPTIAFGSADLLDVP